MAPIKSRWKIGVPCHYCGVPMTPTVGDGIPVDTGATKDHKITQKAFRKVKCEVVRKQKNDPDNLLLACFRCNNLRGDTDYEVFLQFSRYVIRQAPYAPTPLLRLALVEYKEHLCAIGVRNKAGNRQALSLSLLSIAEQLR